MAQVKLSSLILDSFQSNISPSYSGTLGYSSADTEHAHDFYGDYRLGHDDHAHVMLGVFCSLVSCYGFEKF